MGNIAIAHLMEEEGIQTILHLCCRDKNLIGLQASLLEASALGITSILAVTGDPAKVGDQPGATSVFDLNSISLIRLIKQLNQGKNLSGNSIWHPTNFSIGCAFNPNADDLNLQLKRLSKKMQAGAQYALSQPFYEKGKIGELYQMIRKSCGDFPVFLGILPLVSLKNAEYLNYEVPGIKIPKKILQRLEETPEHLQKQEGLKIAKELAQEALAFAPGVYIIPPLNNLQIAQELVLYVKDQSGNR
jgi:homocysteine S-methyltransferase